MEYYLLRRAQVFVQRKESGEETADKNAINPENDRLSEVGTPPPPPEKGGKIRSNKQKTFICAPAEIFIACPRSKGRILGICFPRDALRDAINGTTAFAGLYISLSMEMRWRQELTPRADQRSKIVRVRVLPRSTKVHQRILGILSLSKFSKLVFWSNAIREFLPSVGRLIREGKRFLNFFLLLLNADLQICEVLNVRDTKLWILFEEASLK